MQEIWKPVPFEPFSSRYIISNLGRVKPIKKSKFSNSKEEFLKPGVGARGYGYVVLYCDGAKKQCAVHRMVAMAFIGDPPEGKEFVCHLDDVKTNNVVTNLMWGDHFDNMGHKVAHGRSMRGSKHPRAVLTEDKVRLIRRLSSEGATGVTIAKELGIATPLVSQVLLRKTWGHVE